MVVKAWTWLSKLVHGCQSLYTLVHDYEILYMAVHGCTWLYKLEHGCTNKGCTSSSIAHSSWTSAQLFFTDLFGLDNGSQMFSLVWPTVAQLFSLVWPTVPQLFILLHWNQLLSSVHVMCTVAQPKMQQFIEMQIKIQFARIIHPEYNQQRSQNILQSGSCHSTLYSSVKISLICISWQFNTLYFCEIYKT